MKRLVAAVALALLAACAESQVAPGGAAARTDPAAASLGSIAPDVRISLGRAPARAALLEVTVTEVRNPDREPVTLALALIVDGGAPAPLSNVSLFPADQPGRFLVRLPSAVASTLDASRERTVELTASLVRGPASGPSSPLSLVVTARWAAEPRR